VTPLTRDLASELARRALKNIAREYPNHPQYLLESDADLAPPRIVHPVFFGCFDWHSAVHTHWLLLRLLQRVTDWPLRAEIEAALDGAFTQSALRVEAEYLEKRPSFERPYGLAWLMLLVAETAPTRWREPLAPLAAVARANLLRWLGAMRHAVRSGTHNQTAFALTLAFDAAASLSDAELETSVRRACVAFYLDDVAASLAYEPSGEDFLSPTLMEADLLRRLLPQHEFAAWLARFLPSIPLTAEAAWLPCGEVADATDGKWVHLHGLNLSRAWNLRNIAAALPREDARRGALAAAAERHAATGLQATLAGHDYAGDHWLPSFAGYLITGPGITGPGRASDPSGAA
jgi:hypothetical protein